MAKNDLDSLSIEELAALRENATDKLLEMDQQASMCRQECAASCP